jgi:hypothetical protein
MKRPNRRKEARRKTREKQKQTMKIKNNNDMDINISINNNDISIDNNSNRNKNDIQDRTEQGIYDICKEHFSIIADPRFSVTKNINHLLDNYHAADLPRQPNNLKSS